MIKLVAGKYYRAVDGTIHGPLAKNGSAEYPYTASDRSWKENGCYTAVPDSRLNLIEELVVTSAGESQETAKAVTILKLNAKQARAIADNLKEFDGAAIVLIVEDAK